VAQPRLAASALEARLTESDCIDPCELYPTLRAPKLTPEAIGRNLVSAADRVVRWISGVREFCDGSQCLLRIARVRAPASLRLGGSVYVLRGSEIVDLHLWNERLSGLPSSDNGLSRANALRRRLAASLSELADYIDREPSMREVVALRARTTFVPKHRLPKLLRTAQAFGFGPAVVVGRRPRPGTLYSICEALFRRMLAWAFNPGRALEKRSACEPCDLWISRAVLRTRYGRATIEVRPQPETAGRLREVAGRPANSTPRSKVATAVTGVALNAKARVEGGNKCRSTG